MTGRNTPPQDVVGGALAEFRKRVNRSIQDLETPDAAQLAELLVTFQQLIDNLSTTVGEQISLQSYTRSQIDQANAAQDTQITTAPVDAARVSGILAPAKGGTGSAAPYSNDLSAFGRRTTWMTEGSVLGYAPSTRASKQEIRPADLDPEQLRAITVSLYRYRSAVARQSLAAEFDCVAAPYSAPTEIGVIADDLHSAGLWPFVIYDGHGDDAEPVGVHIELMGLAALSLAQHAYTALDELAERVSQLEQNGSPA